MNRKALKLLLSFVMIMIVSCDEPETYVTNIIHKDGSVTRKIEMKSDKNKFKLSDIQVPLDSTWVTSDSCEISDKGDTTWVKRALKNFADVDEINLAYKNDSGSNRNVSRHASFSRKFRWFNTLYRFSETIDKRLKYGYPISSFLNEKELLWFYSPFWDNEAKLKGADSLYYKSLKDSVEIKKEEWTIRCIVSEWIGELSELIQQSEGATIDSIRRNEDYLFEIIRSNEEDLDSLWQSGYILKEFIGEQNALKYRIQADSSLDIVEDRSFESFSEYSVRISMPGTLTASNGFAELSQDVVWPVLSDYFIAEDYEMWAESKVPNGWAWIVSAAFVVFVLSGVIVRRIRKG